MKPRFYWIWIAAFVIFFTAGGAYIAWPKLLYVSLSVFAALIIAATLIIAPRPLIWKQVLNYLILPLTLTLSAVIYSTFYFPSSGLIKFILLLLGVFMFFYYSNIYRCWHFPETYKLENLETIYSFGAWLAMFFGASAVYGLQYFLNLPIWLPTTILLAIIMLLTYKSLWIKGLDARHNLLFIFLLPFIIVQIGWALYFLPFNFNVLGLILATLYFLAADFIKLHLTHSLNRLALRRHLALVAIVLFLVLIFVQWR
jgi:hypothetical protein